MTLVERRLEDFKMADIYKLAATQHPGIYSDEFKVFSNWTEYSAERWLRISVSIYKCHPIQFKHARVPAIERWLLKQISKWPNAIAFR